MAFSHQVLDLSSGLSRNSVVVRAKLTGPLEIGHSLAVDHWVLVYTVDKQDFLNQELMLQELLMLKGKWVIYLLSGSSRRAKATSRVKPGKDISIWY